MLVKVKHYFPQVLSAFTISLSAISDGIHSGWTPMVLMKFSTEEDSPIKVSQFDVDLLELIYLIGALVGLSIILPFVDYFGRKNAIQASSLYSLISWVLIASARKVEMLYIARFIAGMSSSSAFVAMPMYIGEISEKEIRGFTSAAIPIMISAGLLISYTLAPYVSIPTIAAFGSGLHICHLFATMFLPKTPYHYVSKGTLSEGQHWLQWLRMKNNVENELNDIEREADETFKGGKFLKFKQLFTVPSNKTGIVLMIVLNASQNFASVTVMFKYIKDILVDAAGLMDEHTCCILFASIMLSGGLTCACVVDICGRKKLLLYSTVIAAISLGIIAVYLTLEKFSFDLSNSNWLLTSTVLLYGATYRLGIGSIYFVLASELFPTGVKAMALVVSYASYIFFAILAGKIYKIVYVYLGTYVVFYFFLGCCISTLVFVIFAMPETKGKSLQQIQYMLKDITANQADKNEKPPEYIVIQKIHKHHNPRVRDGTKYF